MTKEDDDEAIAELECEAIALLETAANAMHNDLSDDERKVLGDRLFGLAQQLRQLRQSIRGGLR